MNTRNIFCCTLAVLVCGVLAAKEDDSKKWQDTFDVKKENFVNTGKNKFWSLEPGYQLVFASDDKSEELIITVLDETKKVDGVETRVIEERESEDGKLIEISRNYFAMDKTTQNVYYFGEDVDMYKDGKVTGHGGSWLAGVNGAKFGLMMPAEPKVGERYYQEIAPEVAMDRAETKSVTDKVKTPAGEFENCLTVEESTPLEKGKGKKYYAPGVGLLRDGGVKLVKYGKK